MYVVRDVFRCKPGHAKSIADRFKKMIPIVTKMKGVQSGRVLVDSIASYWTVVLEIEVESLAAYESEMTQYGSSNEAQEIMKGYMDEVQEGRREIFRVA